VSVPIAMTEEQQGMQASLRDWAKRAAPLAVALVELRAVHPAIRKLIGAGHRQAVAERVLGLPRGPR
jgi:hypothetical protein